MSLKRLLTAMIGLPIIIIIMAFGNKYIVDCMCAIIAIISIHEYSKCAKNKANVISWIGYILAICIAFIHVIPLTLISNMLVFGIPVLLVILFLHIIITDMKITFEDISFTLIGILYVLGFILFIPLTYGIEGNISGKILIWYIFSNAWGTDTFAYLIGKHFGKHKFSKVSPNKSIEGCIGGIVGAVLISLVFTLGMNYYFGFNISYSVIAGISIILSMIGQVGDFSASTIKRYFEVKDFSKLFPGHGGMIDRIDSVMFIAPFAYFLLTMFL